MNPHLPFILNIFRVAIPATWDLTESCEQTWGVCPPCASVTQKQGEEEKGLTTDLVANAGILKTGNRIQNGPSYRKPVARLGMKFCSIHLTESRERNATGGCSHIHISQAPFSCKIIANELGYTCRKEGNNENSWKQHTGSVAVLLTGSISRNSLTDYL